MALDRSMDQSLQSSLLEEPCSADPLLRADSSSLTNEVDVQTPPQFIYLHLPPLVHAGTESIESH